MALPESDPKQSDIFFRRALLNPNKVYAAAKFLYGIINSCSRSVPLIFAASVNNKVAHFFLQLTNYLSWRTNRSGV